jgi:pimeloyl-ACP methyl ester carboxylesterase
MDNHAADLLDVMDRLGIDRAFFSGHSMGAHVANAAAALAPERCLGVVMLDGGVLRSSPEFLEGFRADLEPVLERLRVVYPTLQDYKNFWTSEPYVDDFGPIAEQYVAYDLRPVPGGFQPKCSYQAALADWDDLNENPDTVARLSTLSAPLLVVAAEHGLLPNQPPLLGDVEEQRLHDEVADTAFVRVAGTTHHGITLAPDGARATAAALQKFIDRVVG